MRQSASPTSLKEKHGAVLFCIIGAAFLLRFWGVDFGLPHLYHADEPIVVNHALAYGTGDFNPHFFNIPPLASYMLFFLYGVTFVAGKMTGLIFSASQFESLFFSDPTFFYLTGRIAAGVFPGTAAVYFLYRLTKRHFSSDAAFIAALFLAVNFLHARDSHYIYADIPLVLVLVLAMNSILKLRKTFSPAQHLICGFFIGLAAAFKYNGVFLAIPYAYAAFSIQRVRALRMVLIAAGASIVTFFVFNPYALLDWSTFARELAEQSAANRGSGILHHFIYSFFGAFGWPMALLALTGMIFPAPGKFRFGQRVLTVFVLAYYVVLIFKAQAYSRYLLPMVPFLCVLAAWVPAAILEDKERRAALFPAVSLLLFICVLPPLVKTVFWDRLMTRPDNRTLARDWIEKHVPRDSVVALDGDFLMPRLRFSPAQLEEKKQSLRAADAAGGARERRLDALYQDAVKFPAYTIFFLNKNPQEPRFSMAGPVVPYDLMKLRELGVQYVVTADTYHGDTSRDSFYSDLAENGEKVKTLTPYFPPTERSFFDEQPLTGGPFLWREVVSRERNGSILNIYALKAPGSAGEAAQR